MMQGMAANTGVDVDVVDGSVDSVVVETAPVPRMHLHHRMFCALAVAGAAVVVFIGVRLNKGLVVVRHVYDPVGSSKNADWYVEAYQTVNGFLSSFIEMFTEWYFGPLWAVVLTYLANIAWLRQQLSLNLSHHSSRNDDEPGRHISMFLLWMPPVMMYFINVGFTSMFVDHQIVSVTHKLKIDDLQQDRTMHTQARAANNSAVVDTVLRPLLTGQVKPFEMVPRACQSNLFAAYQDLLANTSNSSTRDWVSASDLGSTAVSYGFQAHDWNFEAIENISGPTVSITIAPHHKDADEKVGMFTSKTGMTLQDAYDLLVHGLIFVERSIANSATDVDRDTFNCDGSGQRVLDRPASNETWITLYVDDDSSLFYVDSENVVRDASGAAWVSLEDSEWSVEDFLIARPVSDSVVRIRGGKIVAANGTVVRTWSDVRNIEKATAADEASHVHTCRGVPTSVGKLTNYQSPSNQTTKNLMFDAGNVLSQALSVVDPSSLTVRFDSFRVSSNIQLTAMTVDIAADPTKFFQNTTEVCSKAKLNNAPCHESDVFVFAFPERKCSNDSCVFQDPTEARVLRQQIQINPFFHNITIDDLAYNPGLMMQMPRDMEKHETAAFVFGSGRYITAQRFDEKDDLAYLKSPRRHYVFTFAKLEWQYSQLDDVFNAECAVYDCTGLEYQYQSSKEAAAFSSLKDHDRGKSFRFLLAGADNIAGQLDQEGFQSPTTLVSIFSPWMLNVQNNRFIEWEVLRRRHVQEWDQSLQVLSPSKCPREVEAYISQINDNWYFLDEPVMPVLASSFFFLFQRGTLHDAQVVKAKAKTKNSKVKGYGGGVYNVAIDLKGNAKERKIIRFKVAGFSVYVTCIGLILMWFATAAVMVCKKRHHKVRKDQRLAQQYMEAIDTESYPPAVHERMLLIPMEQDEEMNAAFDGAKQHDDNNSKAVLRRPSGAIACQEVDLDEYDVERLLLRHEEDVTEPIALTNTPTRAPLNDLSLYRPTCSIQ